MIEPQNYFYVNDGSVLKDLNDLLNKMKDISNDAFSYHVNSGKNDFANWTKNVLKDSLLARNMQKANSPQDIIKVIEKRMESKQKIKIKKEEKKSLINEIKDAHS